MAEKDGPWYSRADVSETGVKLFAPPLGPPRSTGSSSYRDRDYLASNVQGVQAQDLKRPAIAR